MLDLKGTGTQHYAPARVGRHQDACTMAVRVEVRDGEDVSLAVARFRRMVDREYRRPWVKRRRGYHEKPTTLRRKRDKLWWRTSRFQGGGTLHLYLGLKEQFQREGPFAMGR